MRVLLIISGGIAAYKALDLIRLLRRRGDTVRVALTAAATRFVTPLSVAALSGDRVYEDLFSLTDEAEMGHIRLSRDADVVAVVPASADLLARMAHGHADDLATTLLLASDKPIVVAPAMNPHMWTHPATRANVALLQARGIIVAPPPQGVMVCGETGPGRLADLEDIARALDAACDGTRLDGAGLRALVTAGPTHEPLDPVRYLGNRSSGRQGYAIAAALAARGVAVSLVSGPTALSDPDGVTVHRVETASAMADACARALPVAVAVCAAAVSDWRPAQPQSHKIKKTAAAAPPPLVLKETPDILAYLAQPGPQRPSLVVGFAAETEALAENAARKRCRKGCDWLLANDVSSGVFGAEETEILFVDSAGAESWPPESKHAVAARLATRILAHFGRTGS